MVDPGRAFGATGPLLLARPGGYAGQRRYSGTHDHAVGEAASSLHLLANPAHRVVVISIADGPISRRRHTEHTRNSVHSRPERVRTPVSGRIRSGRTTHRKGPSDPAAPGPWTPMLRTMRTTDARSDPVTLVRRGPHLVRIREIRPTDQADLQHFYAGLSPESRRARFLSVRSGLSQAQSISFCTTDHDHREGLGGPSRW